MFRKCAFLSVAIVMILSLVACSSTTPEVVNEETAGEEESPVAEVVEEAGGIVFPDPNLESAIREAINKPEGDVLLSDLEGLTSLDAGLRGITDLSGLEYCTSLTELNLSWRNELGGTEGLAYVNDDTGRNIVHDIDDISLLASLTDLTSLDLSGNDISDISPLASLTDLTVLDLSWNDIDDISPLASLTNLTVLNLSGNDISDISPLASLTDLTELNLSGNAMSDISPLASLTNLTVLDLDWNDIDDISVLTNLTNLTWLNLGHNPLDDESVDTIIPQLEQSGVTVTHDPTQDDETP